MANKRVRKIKDRTKELPWKEKPKRTKGKDKRDKTGTKFEVSEEFEMPKDRIIKSCKRLPKVQPLIFENGKFRRK